MSICGVLCLFSPPWEMGTSPFSLGQLWGGQEVVGLPLSTQQGLVKCPPPNAPEQVGIIIPQGQSFPVPLIHAGGQSPGSMTGLLGSYQVLCVVVHCLRLSSQCRGLGFDPDQGTRSDMPQLKILSATVKTEDLSCHS